MAYKVIPSNGDLLILTTLNMAGYNDNNGHGEFHPLRVRMRVRFAGEKSNPFVIGAFNRYLQGKDHPLPPAGYRVHLLERQLGIPSELYQGVERDAEIFEGFRKSTSFDKFYVQIVGEYRAICDEVRKVLSTAPLEAVLQDAWEMPAFEGIVVPQPLDAPNRGEGQKVGKYAVAFIGPGEVNKKLSFSDLNIKHMVAHEWSHPYGDEVWRQITEIAKARGMGTRLDDFVRKQEVGGYKGEIVLIETMMRALQDFYIDPNILDLPVVPDEEISRYEKKQHGFENVPRFDNAIREHKENPKGETLAEAVFNGAIGPFI